ncbi:MAG: hypothetical protein KGL74_12245, partial [Elusimicrobia bacterium]|nr:hypothetical protein [Elusimicrobiota bacterium]
MYVPLDESVTVANVAAPTRRAITTAHDHAGHLHRIGRFPAKPKILLLEPFYPAEAAWGSVKVEQGFLPPLGLISIYRWLKDKGYDAAFADTQFGDFTEQSLKAFLREGRYDLVGLPLFTPTADHVFHT